MLPSLASLSLVAPIGPKGDRRESAAAAQRRNDRRRGVYWTRARTHEWDEQANRNRAQAAADEAAPPDCAFCITSLGELCTTLSCAGRHKFHTDCLRAWVAHSFLTFCPTCREPNIPELEAMVPVEPDWKVMIISSGDRNDGDDAHNYYYGITEQQLLSLREANSAFRGYPSANSEDDEIERTAWGFAEVFQGDFASQTPNPRVRVLCQHIVDSDEPNAQTIVTLSARAPGQVDQYEEIVNDGDDLDLANEPIDLLDPPPQIAEWTGQLTISTEYTAVRLDGYNLVWTNTASKERRMWVLEYAQRLADQENDGHLTHAGDWWDTFSNLDERWSVHQEIEGDAEDADYEMTVIISRN
jgi:hypothetical protein